MLNYLAVISQRSDIEPRYNVHTLFGKGIVTSLLSVRSLYLHVLACSKWLPQGAGYRISDSESRPQKLHNLQIQGMLTYSLWYAYFFSVSPWSSQGQMISMSWIHLWNTTRYSTKSHTWAIHVHFSDAEFMTSLVDRRRRHLPSWRRRRVLDDGDSSDNSLPMVTNHQ